MWTNICENCGATLNAGEKCDCEKEGKPEEKSKPQIFTIKAARCRRCGGILTSDYGLRNGIGSCCYRRELDEKVQQADDMQIKFEGVV